MSTLPEFAARALRRYAPQVFLAPHVGPELCTHHQCFKASTCEIVGKLLVKFDRRSAASWSHDNGAGRCFDALAASFRQADRILLFGDASVMSICQWVLIRKRFPALNPRMHWAGMCDRMLEGMMASRRLSLQELLIDADSTDLALLDKLRRHRRVLTGMLGPLCTDLVLAGRELHLESLYNAPEHRDRFPRVLRAFVRSLKPKRSRNR